MRPKASRLLEIWRIASNVFPPRGGRQTPQGSDEGDAKHAARRDSKARPTSSGARRPSRSSSPSSGPSGHLPPRGGKAVRMPNPNKRPRPRLTLPGQGGRGNLRPTSEEPQVPGRIRRPGRASAWRRRRPIGRVEQPNAAETLPIDRARGGRTADAGAPARRDDRIGRREAAQDGPAGPLRTESDRCGSGSGRFGRWPRGS